MSTKTYRPYRSPFDPCPPQQIKTYETPPELYLGFQPYDTEQYPPNIALKKGTLWPALDDPYHNPYEYPAKGGKQ